MTILNVPQLIKDLTPMNLRQPIRNDWLYALNVQLVNLYNNFLTQRDEDIYDVNHSGQLLSLQELLNDKFDPVNRLITIDDGVWLDDFYLYNKEEKVYTYLYNKDEVIDPSLQQYIFNNKESEDRDKFYDFIVNVPNILTSEEKEIRLYIDRYKAFGFVYKLIFI